MLPSVYVETTIFSYLTARPSGSLITAAHQRVTSEWWRVAPDRYRLLVSAIVVQEARGGDPAMAEQRVAFLSGLPLLEVAPEARELARALVAVGVVPADAAADALHIAVAAVNRVDYLVTWNLRHLAGAVVRRRIERALRERGFEPPMLCTPEELLSDSSNPGGLDVQ